MSIAQNYASITIGGPCKITDGAAVFYTEGAVTLNPKLTYRDIPSSVGGDQDKVLVDLVWTVSFTPKSVYNATLRGVLINTSITNFTTSGARLCGTANRSVTILGADGDQYILTRAIITKPPEMYLGLGKSLWGAVEYTAFCGAGNVFSDATAFFTYSTANAWVQTDFPTTHQEAECTLAWGAVTGWDTVFAEGGFTLSHEVGLEPIKQGNVTVDYKILKYRGMLKFKPQEPTSAQLLTALNPVIGTRLSSNANNAVVTGAGISVTLANAAVNTGSYVFDNKLNRHGEWGMITALTAPGTRLTLA